MKDALTESLKNEPLRIEFNEIGGTNLIRITELETLFYTLGFTQGWRAAEKQRKKQ